jgi:hypothetical protein
MTHAASLIAAALATLAAASAHGATNLIVNGSFEDGASGFGTDYNLSASGCIGCVGVQTTTTGWYNAPGYVFPYGDHTSGSGRMLQWDPPEPPGSRRIWYQSVNVVAGTRYTFSGWVREANSEATPNNGRLGVYVGTTLLGSQDAPDNRWAAWSFDWTAAATGPVVLSLRDLYPTTWNGTYSTLDDLAFTAAVPEPGSWLLMAGGLLALARRLPRRG